MAFIQSGTLDPHGAPVLRHDILTNSITFVVGESLKLTSGFPTHNTAGVAVYGHLAEVETNKGVGVNTTGISGAVMGSYINSYLTASDNQTVGKARGIIDISRNTMYSALLSAAIGTTTGSNLLGYLLDLTDEATINEASAVTTTCQYFNWGVDPKVSSRIIVTVHESLIFGTDN